MKKASIYKFSSHFIISPDNTTKIGYSVSSAPYVKVDLDASDSLLGETLLNALNMSRNNVEVSSKNPDEFLAGMRIRSIKDLSKNVYNCFTYMKDGIITIIPTRNEKGSFVHMPDEKIEILNKESVEKIGEALQIALAKCE